MTLAQFVNCICRYLEIPALSPAPSTNSYSLVIDQKWDITFYLKQKFIYISGKLGEPVFRKETKDNTLLQRLLQFNLKRLADSDEMLSFDEKMNQLVLRKVLNTSALSEQNAAEYFEDFLNTLEIWHKLFFSPGSSVLSGGNAIPFQGIRL